MDCRLYIHVANFKTYDGKRNLDDGVAHTKEFVIQNTENK